MIQLIDSGWNKTLKAGFDRKTSEISIVCPFIKSGAIKKLLGETHPAHIRVITRFNLADFHAGVSDIDALGWLLARGSEVRGIKGLHAKVYVFGTAEAIVTSANLTAAALQKNHEFGFVTRDHGLVSRCRDYFETTWNAAGNNLTCEWFEAMKQKLDVVGAAGSPPSSGADLGDEGANVGEQTKGISILPGAVSNAPPAFAEAEQSFVKFLGTSDDRESLDLPVIDELVSSGAHWACGYPEGKRPRGVRDGAVMFFGRLVEGPDIRIIGRALAKAHVPKRDEATEEEKNHRTWKRTWPNYIRVHDAEFLDGTLADGVSLSEMMDELKAHAFASTKRNIANGSGNTDPRHAYRQQAAVELSDEGFVWMARKLQEAFQQCGKIPAELMQKLDWPAAV